MGERVIITGGATAVNQVKGAFSGSGPLGVVLEVWAIAGMGERVIITGGATAVNQVKGAFAGGEPITDGRTAVSNAPYVESRRLRSCASTEHKRDH
jgi:Flp pilus assembly pilin Flp